MYIKYSIFHSLEQVMLAFSIGIGGVTPHLPYDGKAQSHASSIVKWCKKLICVNLIHI